MKISFQRRNFHGRQVSLWGGTAVGALLASSQSLIAKTQHDSNAGKIGLAATGAALAGFCDDMSDSEAINKSTKGLKGHLGALREGRLSPGLVKMLMLIFTGLLAAKPRRDLIHYLAEAGVIAGSANLVNLLDLRPGRALKIAALAAAAGFIPGGEMNQGTRTRCAAANLAVVGAALPLDLREITMLGDTGANALGASLGAVWAKSRSKRGNLITLAIIAVLTLASEKISFSKVIAHTPALKAWDDWGRLPD